MDLEQAVGKHAEWKMKLRSAITKQETLDAATIAKDNCCEVGKWLHGEGKLKCANLASYSDCVQKHAAFHAEAGKVAKTINAKDFKNAEVMLGNGTSYAAASSAVGVALMRLKKESAQ